MIKLLTIPLSWIYALITALRNKMFDWNILKSKEYDIPVVCIGNISVGGTGKTPHTEMLIRLLATRYNIGVISRGYKRKSSGYYEVTANSSVKKVGDEPKQIKLNFPDIPVVVCENRNIGIAELRKKHPEINLVIMDDGFQHRRVETWLNIILTDFSNPIYEDHILPWGRLREGLSSLARAHIVIVSKMPDKVKPIEMRLISKFLNLYPYQVLFFTKIVQKRPQHIFDEFDYIKFNPKSKVIALAAIAKPKAFVEQLTKRYNVVDLISYPDHYIYRKKDLAIIEEKIKEYGDDAVILMTEKDAVKFASSKIIPDWIRCRMYKVPIEVKFVEADLTRNNTEEHFIERVLPYVKQNQKYNTLGF
ncbi:MAG: tetraacyldisaccharide 4'-kinase [Rikenellaceae bacterium]